MDDATTDDKVWLRVPYDEKDEAKRLGARWDAAARRWWVHRDSYPKVRAHNESWVVASAFSIRVDGRIHAIENLGRCSRCSVNVPVVALLASRTSHAYQEDDEDEPDYWGSFDPEPAYLAGLRGIEDERLRKQLQMRWPGYRPGRYKRYRNHCAACGFEFHERNELYRPGGPLAPNEDAPFTGSMKAHPLCVALPAFFDAGRTWIWSDRRDLYASLRD